MNIFSALFGIFRQRGLVETIKSGGSLFGFILVGILFSLIGGVLYGFAMGIGLGIETALKDAAKVGLIVSLSLLFSLPVFWVAYRLLGREERPGQVAAVPLTLVATVALILAVTAPIVFFLSILAGFSQEAAYIHIVIVDVAMLVGLYLAGTLIYHSFPDTRRLVIPNVVGFLILAVTAVVLILFLGPFLSLRPTFSVGTDRLKNGLGIGVAERVNQALAAASAADRVSYRFQTTNDNGDLLRDYTVTRAGNDYLIDVHLHAVPGEPARSAAHIWILDGQFAHDFDQGRVQQSGRVELASFLDPALPPAPFTLPSELGTASWRAFETGGAFTASGVSPTQEQAVLILESGTGRLRALTIGSAGGGPHAESRVSEVAPAALDRAGMQASLNRATVLGNVDRSDASMEDFVEGDTFFVARYPGRTWRAGSWNPGQRQVDFTTSCARPEGCPALEISAFDLAEGKGPQQYAEDLGQSLSLQAEYRVVQTGTTTVRGQTVGVMEYRFDRPVEGKIETTHHIEYIFVGQLFRYHLDFSSPESTFEANRGLFEAMAGGFTYLQ